MNISIELTLTPLQDNFEKPIIEFIKQLRVSGCTIMENPLSTQIYGDFDTVMSFLNPVIKSTFMSLDHVILNMKIVKSDRSSYEPSF